MKKASIIKIFEDAMGYVPVTILMANSKSADKVSVTFKDGQASKLIVSPSANFDDVCDVLEAIYPALPEAA